jgi:hypothetical protein
MSQTNRTTSYQRRFARKKRPEKKVLVNCAFCRRFQEGSGEKQGGLEDNKSEERKQTSVLKRQYIIPIGRSILTKIKAKDAYRPRTFPLQILTQLSILYIYPLYTKLSWMAYFPSSGKKSWESSQRRKKRKTKSRLTSGVKGNPATLVTLCFDLFRPCLSVCLSVCPLCVCMCVLLAGELNQIQYPSRPISSERAG